MNEKKDRLFVPLESKYHRLFKKGEKTWEIRGYNARFNWGTVGMGRKVELRLGYTSDPIWGTVTRVMVIRERDEIPEYVEKGALANPALVEKLRKKYGKLIAFEIKLDEVGR